MESMCWRLWRCLREARCGVSVRRARLDRRDGRRIGRHWVLGIHWISRTNMSTTSFAMGVPIRVSFEFFPPGDAAMEATLWKSVERLAPLSPRFVSVTYGADGSTRERTHNL